MDEASGTRMSLALCDSHRMFLDALAGALEDRGHEIVATLTEPRQLARVLSARTPDVCLLGLGSLESEWLEAALAVKRNQPDVRVVLLGGSGSLTAWTAYESGTVDALVDKRCDIVSLDKVIQRVSDGEHLVEGWARPTREQPVRSPLDYLTDREREVLGLIVAGLSTQRMSTVLGVSANTVRTHVQHVLAKLGVDRRSKAIKVAVDLGLTTWAQHG
jgi:DNA-binding NarL/FixJ family response regulator